MLLGLYFLFWKEFKRSETCSSISNTEHFKSITTHESEINLKFSKYDTSDPNLSKKTANYIEPIFPVTNNFFSDNDVILDSFRNSTENKNLPSAPSVSETNSKNLGTGSTVHKSNNSEQNNSYSENSKNSTVTVQKPPLSSLAVAPAVTPAVTSRPNHFLDQCDVDPPPFSLTPQPVKKNCS